MDKHFFYTVKTENEELKASFKLEDVFQTIIKDNTVTVIFYETVTSARPVQVPQQKGNKVEMVMQVRQIEENVTAKVTEAEDVERLLSLLGA